MRALLVLLLAADALDAQAPPQYQYKSLRADEDWRWLRDAIRSDDAFDVLKYLPTGTDGARWVTLGGEVRERYEYFHDALWGAGPQDADGYLLQRYMLHG